MADNAAVTDGLDPETVTELEAAESLLAAGAIDEAAAAFAALSLAAPDDVAAWVGSGRCARAQGDRERALACFEAAAALRPEDPLRLVDVADDLRELGRLAAAQAQYYRCLALQPDFVWAHVGLGYTARRRGDLRAAVRHFAAAADIWPHDPQRGLEVADNLRELGRLDDAEAEYNRVLGLAPDNVWGHVGLGHTARLRGARAAALGHFQAAAAIWPDDPRLALEVAEDLRALGRLDEAEGFYARVLAAEPGNGVAEAGMGHAARQRGDRLAALAHFAAAVQAAPEDVPQILYMADELRALDRLAEAAAQYELVLGLQPENIWGHLGLGHVARKQGRRDAALAHYETAARHAPGHKWPRIEIAAEYCEAGDLAAARRMVEELLHDDPADLHALLRAAEIARAEAKHEAALAIFETAHAHHPDEADILVQMAVEARVLGNQARCDDYLARALALNPLLVSAISQIAELAIIKGEITQAFEVYQRAAAAQPGEMAFQLGMLDALAAMGETELALTALAELEESRGPVLDLRAKRINLLRQAGRYYESVALARAATAIWPAHFWIWVERFQSEIFVGDDADIETCLREIPAATVKEKAIVLRNRGYFAERRWLIDEAVALYEESAAVNAEATSALYDLVRMQLVKMDIPAARHYLQLSCAQDAPNTRLRGKSTNISQTFYGQILDEYRLNDRPAGMLKALQNETPPQARVNSALALVRAQPGNTAAAVALFLALRTAEGIHIAGPPQEAVIPKVITQFWDAEEIPEDIARLMRSWQELNPEHEVRVFSDAAARAYLQGRFAPAVLAAYRRMQEPAQKADFFRLALLSADGGLYTDADDRCLNPLATLLPEDAAMVLYQEELGTLGNNFIATVPRHPVMLAALQMAVTAINRGDRDIVWLSTGPGLLTRACAQIIAAGAMPGATYILDRRRLFRAVGIHCAANYKKANRHWSNAMFAETAEA